MSTPITIAVENVVLEIIRGQAPFTNATNAPTANYDLAQNLIDKSDILFVRAENPTPFAGARKPSLPAPVYMSQVTAEIRFTSNNINKINDWESGLDAAMLQTSSFPSNATNIVNTTFPGGFEIDIPQGGDRQGEGSNQRSRTRTFRVIFRT